MSATAVEVYKFGGTSVKDAGRIQRVVELVLAEDAGLRRVVVTSALGGVTDRLLAAIDEALARTGRHRAIVEEVRQRHLAVVEQAVPPAEQDGLRASTEALLLTLSELLDGVSLLRECSPRAKDAIGGMGERLSAPLLAAAFRAAGAEAVAVDAGPLVRTDDRFGEATVDFGVTDRLVRAYFDSVPVAAVAVVTGFVGSTSRGVSTTLGRSGSDYTATIFAGALRAQRCVIWTDVDGVLSADPRLVPEAAPLAHLNYREAAELAYFGAKVLHPRTMRPLVEQRIPLVIKNTLNPSAAGTRITGDVSASEAAVRGVTAVRGVSLVTLEGTDFVGVVGVVARAVGALADAGVDVLMTSQASSEEAVSMVVRSAQGETARHALERAFADVITRGDARVVFLDACAIVTAVGDGMRARPGIAGRLFEALGFEDVSVEMIAQSALQNSISAVVEDRHARAALRAMHEAFHPNRERVRVAVVGATGGVGRALVRMVREHAQRLHARTDLRLDLVALASSSRMAYDPNGLPPGSLGRLAAARTRAGARCGSGAGDPADGDAGEPLDLALLVQRLKDLPYRRIVFVDATASDAVAAVYPELLEAGIAVVTPNKRANTGPLAVYQQLQALAKETPFLYETTVGASLPVLSTLRDLVRSGDVVRKIEGALSGTLAFVLSEVMAGMPFSAAVALARARGYTEPDPRDDLSGRDVARKLLTLAREVGHDVEPEAVEVESLVPETLHGGSVDDFLAALPAYDALWADRVAALPPGHRLGYVGTLEGERLHVGLRTSAPDSPLGVLRSTDSLVAFTTERYERPVVVMGPGAGPEVTAAGVLADIAHAAFRMGERL